MGYTHYWRRARELDEKKFQAASRDCAIVCDAMLKILDISVPLAGGGGTGSPDFLPYCVCFNGVGGDEYETFRILDKGPVFDFCKTAGKPYDLAVQCCLIVFSHHFGGDFRVSSDGEKDDWQRACDVCQALLEYGEDFQLD